MPQIQLLDGKKIFTKSIMFGAYKKISKFLRN